MTCQLNYEGATNASKVMDVLQKESRKKTECLNHEDYRGESLYVGVSDVRDKTPQ